MRQTNETSAPAQQLTADEVAARHKTAGKAATKGAVYAEFVDMFDIYLPTVILTPAMVFFRPPNLDPGMDAILTSLIFATTLIGRPIGAAIFGHMADSLGRRKTTILSVSGFGIITLLIALVPGYETIGVGSYWILIALRFLDGICLGGGYTGALPLAMEYSPKEKRGLLGGVVLAGFPLAYIVINLIGLASFNIFKVGDVHSSYVQWGWRIPFIIGALVAGALALYYTKSVSESEIWKVSESKSKGSPLREVMRGQNLKNFLQVFLMMTGFWLTQNIVTLFIPSAVLPKTLGLTGTQLTTTLLIAYACLIGSYIAAGLIAQKIGRRRFFMILGVLIAVVGSALMVTLMNSKGQSWGLITVLVCAFSILVTAPWGAVLPYITERFHTGVRASGFGLGFSVSVVIPSFYAFFLTGLQSFLSAAAAAATILVIGGILGSIGAAIGPETKDVDFTTD
ncbi:MFS transporter [Paenarthrobacter sp. DKR-5]|uniref:MFS transporter n=1 Tax=Paenarthrobacter sp. DKR-5 TaxID=2835535 RepID=UPI001BDC30F8|nr:MFS transporter [Paenarthrobacter sp. DKR-5]MBT1003936.1 MFS transporter [Paenarthrobacter sp. DKR-5]